MMKLKGAMVNPVAFGGKYAGDRCREWQSTC